jgi:hypothetical protein
MRLFPVPEMPARSINGLVRIAVRKLNEELFFIFVSGKIDKEGEPSGFISGASIKFKDIPMFLVRMS